MLKIAAHIAWNNVGGELALFDGRDGTYHALNESSAAIWRGIAAGLDEGEIVRSLAEEHSAEPGAIGRDVRDFLNLARSKGLLEGGD